MTLIPPEKYLLAPLFPQGKDEFDHIEACLSAGKIMVDIHTCSSLSLDQLDGIVRALKEIEGGLK